MCDLAHVTQDSVATFLATVERIPGWPMSKAIQHITRHQARRIQDQTSMNVVRNLNEPRKADLRAMFAEAARNTAALQSPKPYHGPMLELQLYQHAIADCGALLLSRDGCRRNAKMIPKSLLSQPITTQLVKVDGEPCDFGLFSIAEFKAKEVGWMVERDPAQLKLV